MNDYKLIPIREMEVIEDEMLNFITAGNVQRLTCKSVTCDINSGDCTRTNSCGVNTGNCDVNDCGKNTGCKELTPINPCTSNH